MENKSDFSKIVEYFSIQEFRKRKIAQIHGYDRYNMSEILNDFRNKNLYNLVKDHIIDITMSCDIDEAKNWMIAFMDDAISVIHNIQVYYDLSLASTEYVVAYDLYQGMLKE